MKRVIYGASQSDILKRIKDGFEKAECTDVNVTAKSSNCCTVSLTLPSGNHTTVTVWYDHTMAKNGNYTRELSVDWDSSYIISPSGEVRNSDGDLIGIAKVVVDTIKRPKSKRNYDLSSIRTDSGNVLIDHPEQASNYAEVVLSLEQRDVTIRT